LLSDLLLDLYDTLTEVVFHGDNQEEVAHVSLGSESTSWHFADDRLSWLKKKVDGYLSVTASALRRYEKECGAQAQARHQKEMASQLAPHRS
jgi:hypothetical protein